MLSCFALPQNNYSKGMTYFSCALDEAVEVTFAAFAKGACAPLVQKKVKKINKKISGRVIPKHQRTKQKKKIPRATRHSPIKSSVSSVEGPKSNTVLFVMLGKTRGSPPPTPPQQ